MTVDVPILQRFISSDVYGLNKPVRINGDDVEWLAGWIDSYAGDAHVLHKNEHRL